MKEEAKYLPWAEHLETPPSLKILFKFASRGRPGKFFQHLENIKQNCTGGLETGECFKVVCSIDNDDLSMCRNDRTKELVYGNRIYLKKNYPFASQRISVIHKGHSTKIQAINRDMEHYKKWDILINTSDDMRFLVKGFDTIIRNDMQMHFPDLDGVLHYNDGRINGPNIMTMSIIGRKYYERFGYIYHPDYKSFYCDNEATEVAKMLGKYKYFDTQLFEHMHPSEGAGEWDETYRRNEAHWAEDEKTYQRRKAINFGL